MKKIVSSLIMGLILLGCTNSDNKSDKSLVCPKSTSILQSKNNKKVMSEQDYVMETYNIEGEIRGASNAFVMIAVNESFSGDINKLKDNRDEIYEYIKKECIRKACEMKATYPNRDNIFNNAKSKCISYAKHSLKNDYGI